MQAGLAFLGWTLGCGVGWSLRRHYVPLGTVGLTLATCMCIRVPNNLRIVGGALGLAMLLAAAYDALHEEPDTPGEPNTLAFQAMQENDLMDRLTDDELRACLRAIGVTQLYDYDQARVVGRQARARLNRVQRVLQE